MPSKKKKLLRFIPDAMSHRVLLVILLLLILILTIRFAM